MINFSEHASQIPGEESVRDNDWKGVLKSLNLEPKGMVERLERATDATALAESKQAFVDRANTWPSNKKDNHNTYVIAPARGSEGDFYGPLAYSGVRSPSYYGIKFPELKTDEDRELFAQYSRIIHTYFTNINGSTLKYSNSRAFQKARINASLLLATVYHRCDQKLPPIEYSQSDNTMMSEICGMIGKKVDGTDMTDKEQAQFLSDLADDYVAQIEGKGIDKKLHPTSKGNDQPYGEYKKNAVSNKIQNMTSKEKDALLAQFLSQQRN